MKLGDLLNYAAQAADALAKAHAAGIVHRDLKPSNLMVTGDGRVKILDFGLAKLLVTPLDSSETTILTDPLQTGDGRVVGTPAYMSPEQAEGRPIDSRTDIFSFGALLYEMATGTRAFRGDSTASTLAAVLASTPKPPSQVVPTLPRELERIIIRCLRKEPSRRFQFMADLAVELEEIKTESSERIETAHVPAPRRRWRWVVAAAATFTLIAAGAWSFWPRTRAAGPPTVTSLTTYNGSETQPALSPDGAYVAFVWTGEEQNNSDIYVKPVDAVTPLQLTTDPLPDMLPEWSPSGREIAFTRMQADGRGAIYVSPNIPGSEHKVADVRRTGAGLQFTPAPSWTPDGRWLIVADLTSNDGENGLFLIGVESGQRRAIVTAPLAKVRYVGAKVSPSGDAIAYVGCNVAGTAGCDIWLQPLGADLSAQGDARRLTEFHGGISGLSWMPDGRSLVATASSSQIAFAYLWRVPLSGEKPTRLDWAGSQVYTPTVSATERRLVVARDLSDLDIWRFDLSTPGTPPSRHPASSSLADADPEFSPDGTQIAFASARSGREQEVWIARSDGTGGATLLTRGAAGRDRGSPRWSHDGKRIVFDSRSEDGVRRAYVIDAAGGRSRPASDYHANFPSWSLDDKWIYFGSNRSGRMEVWRVPSDGGTPVQLTREGGDAPRVSTDGTLYYRRESTLYAKPLAGGPDQPIVEGVTGILSAYLPFGNEVFYVVAPEPSRSNLLELRAIDVTTRKSRSISRFEGSTASGLTVAPDGKAALLAVFKVARDLILVENFQ